MSEEMMNTKEVAKYLDIHEKQVYASLKRSIPSTRSHRQMDFPKKLIDEWIESNARRGSSRHGRRAGKLQGLSLHRGAMIRSWTFFKPM